MIFNMSNNSNEGMTAEAVKYGDYSVADTLDGLKFSTNFLSDYVTGVDETVGSLVDELTANGKRIYLDYKDGKYGYNTSATRGADTFSPFRSGGSGDNVYTNLTTVGSITGDQMPTITGSGYITIRRTGYTNVVGSLDVYIDGNTERFRIDNRYDNGLQGDFYKFFFQESIRFANGNASDIYFYQTLLADELIEKKYNITQGLISNGDDYLTITGKGKILLSPSTTNPAIRYSIDGGTELYLTFHGYQYMEYLFDKSFKFKLDTRSIQYIAYTEI